ncbi:MAG: pyridoxamine 5'-phosphate oxidase family protein [Beijerinckiaceae bacterium]|nr:pyridoxamine 5'-phosphate oxidase family protein [Beijerinckiaceae bacterium]
MEASNDYKDRMKVWEMIKDIRIAVMVTTDEEGQLRSRPMAAQQQEFDGSLWFFTSIQSGKIDELEGNPDVLLGYSEPSKQEYVSVNGKAVIVRDREKIKELWSEPLRVWFPKGPDDQEIALIKVTISSAEYWDAPSSTMLYAYGYVKARLTGERPKGGEHKVVNF